jgi:hypothetical protein
MDNLKLSALIHLLIATPILTLFWYITRNTTDFILFTSMLAVSLFYLIAVFSLYLDARERRILQVKMLRAQREREKQYAKKTSYRWTS